MGNTVHTKDEWLGEWRVFLWRVLSYLFSSLIRVTMGCTSRQDGEIL